MNCNSYDSPALRHQCPTAGRAQSESGNAPTAQEQASGYMMIYAFGECVLDTQLHVLSRAGQPVKLRPKAFEVLVYLVEHHDRMVSKDELCAQVWPNQFISDATLGSTVRAVRQAIGDTGEAQQLIQTVHGYGYRCVATVTVCSAMRAAPTTEAAEVLAPPMPMPGHGAAEGHTLRPEPTATRPRPPLATLTRFSPGERKCVTVLCCAPVFPGAVPWAGQPQYAAQPDVGVL
jgi:DNA-binding winged helix-turn-helix (wHTH) protein